MGVAIRFIWYTITMKNGISMMPQKLTVIMLSRIIAWCRA